MKRIVQSAKDNGINAIIAADHAVINFAHKIGMPVHISTQANISNIDTIEFYSTYADVMVMARELSLKQVADITREIKRRDITGPSGKPVRIEIFGHGALCMAISGKCYLSLHSNFASANRGACIQNCRKSYIVTDKEEGTEFEIDNEYIMSAKDLCTIGFLDQVIDSGIVVLKIEGRGRSADYVYTVTECYREAIDSYYSGTYTAEKVTAWMKRLETVFNRGFWDGYYLGKTMGEWNDEYGSKATKKKIYIAKGQKFFERTSIGEFLMESHHLSLGEEIIITGPTTGFLQTVITELRVNDHSVEKVNKGETFTMKVSERIRPSDKLYKMVDA
jgi:putative protease